MPDTGRAILVENLGTHPNDVYTLEGPLGLGGLAQLYDIDRYDLKEPPLVPALPPALGPESTESGIFAAIRQGDILLHHPYESFDPVIDFLKAAARDPDVLAIKQTLYRVGRNSPVVKYLLEARREHRKQVTVLVELKARFDEESNIGWAKMLEREGVHVIYGLLGLKTHAKVLLVVRKEDSGLRRYLHLGTGNYNHVTARLYEDMGLFTCDDDLGADASDLFNYPDRLLPARGVQAPAGGAGEPAPRTGAAHRPRDRARPRRPAGAAHLQGQRPGRPGHDRAAVRGLAGRRRRSTCSSAASAACARACRA